MSSANTIEVKLSRKHKEPHKIVLPHSELIQLIVDHPVFFSSKLRHFSAASYQTCILNRT